MSIRKGKPLLELMVGYKSAPNYVSETMWCNLIVTRLVLMQRNPTKDDATELLGAFTQALTNFDDVVRIYNARI
jgi:hypothetical protein